MKVTINRSQLELVQGDITQQEVDAIVNAANSRLAGGGGVDGAIHRLGGPAIMQETKLLHPNGCPTGSAVITNAGCLAAKKVIHAVAPRWNGGNLGEPLLLASAYRSCLELAIENGCSSIAFPALGAGAYGYPLDQAAEAALTTIKTFLENTDSELFIRFVLFKADNLAVFSRELEEIQQD